MTALLDNQQMDIHANNAQLVKFNLPLMSSNAIPHNVLDSTRLELLSTTLCAVDVIPVPILLNYQTLKELCASTDKLLNALVPRNNHLKDTIASHAQEVQFKIQTTPRNALSHNVSEHMISFFQSMITLVEDANHANGQDKFQTTQELLVSLDHSLNALTALPADLLTDTHAFHAQLVKSRIQLTCQNALTELAADNMKSNSHMITNHAVNVKDANGQPLCQINSGPLALKDQRLNVDADKDNLKMDTLVKHAQLEPYKAQLMKRHV
jgi:hypothetical protein